MGEPAKNGTVTRIYAHACPNETCARYQALVFAGLACHYCGTPLQAASASIGVFRWEPELSER